MTTATPPLWRTITAWLAVPARIGLALVFIFAAFGKIIDPYGFALSIATYQMVPHELLNIQAVTLAWIEMVVGVMLLVGLRIQVTTFILNALLVVFMVAIFSAMQRDLLLGSCGCFASQEAAEELSWGTFYRDILFFAMGIWVHLFDQKKLSVDGLVTYLRRKHA